jgi:hypothetical protein
MCRPWASSFRATTRIRGMALSLLRTRRSRSSIGSTARSHEPRRSGVKGAARRPGHTRIPRCNGTSARDSKTFSTRRGQCATPSPRPRSARLPRRPACGPRRGSLARCVGVAAPHDAGIRPMRSQALCHVLDDRPHLGALRGGRRAQDGRDRRAACHVIDVHRRKAALVVMRVPERQLLAAMRRTEGIVDIEDLQPARLHRGAELIEQSRSEPRRLDPQVPSGTW